MTRRLSQLHVSWIHLQICKGAADYDAPSAPELPVDRLGEAARKALTRATAAVRRYGWLSFWAQLSLSVVSGVILLFSVAFTSQSGPKAALYLTLFGILAGFLSTFWNFGYTRTAMKMQNYLDSPPGADVPKVKKQQVSSNMPALMRLAMHVAGLCTARVHVLTKALPARTHLYNSLVTCIRHQTHY